MEKVVAAAIMVWIKDNDFPQIITAKRHADAFELVHKSNVLITKAIHGFLTDQNRFVDRYEAKDIAVAANQLIVPIEETYNELYSEDVWQADGGLV